jgi:hypothetical protein
MPEVLKSFILFLILSLGGSIVQPVLSSKPVQLAGKPLLQLSGGKGGQPLGVIQTPHGQISALSLIPGALPATAQVSSGSTVSAAASPSPAIMGAKVVNCKHAKFIFCVILLLESVLMHQSMHH